MNLDLEVLIDELKLIRDNNNVDLTHGEIRSFIRAFVSAIDDGTITPFHDLDIRDTNKVKLYLNLIRGYGIPHIDRSRMASKCLKFLEAIDTKKKMLADTQNDNGWEDIPF